MMEKVNAKLVLQNLKEYVRNFDWERYAPIGHGTTRERADFIKENGLLTRKISQRKRDNWNLGNEEKSGEDKVYFETCLESENIGLTACMQAYRQDNPSKMWRPSEKDWRCRYFTVKNPSKYADRMVRDEDNEKIEMLFTHIYSDRPKKLPRKSSFHPPWDEMIEHLPRKLMDYFDLIYAYGERDAEGNVKEIDTAIDIASPILNVGDLGTTAIKGSIPPEDLKVWKPSEYLKMKEERDCKHSLDNDIVKIKEIPKTTWTKRIIAPEEEQNNPYWKIFRYKEAGDRKRQEVRKELKEWIKTHTDEKLKNIH